jgi:dihydroorotate dehydrogenase
MSLFATKPRSLFRPWLWLSPKLAHDLGPLGLQLWCKFFRPFFESNSKKQLSWRSFEWRGLHFRNRLGIAGGVDKTGDSLVAWYQLGCGFVELGTVTPLAQTANPGSILDRDVATEAVWNKMGFPGPGADQIVRKLKSLGDQLPHPLLINIGKNRTTSNELASLDYVRCFEKLHLFADAFVVNISSPNTSGLRALSGADFLEKLLSDLAQAQIRLGTQKPILLKLSPDMSDVDMQTALDVSLANNIDGWILTNTTLSRKPGSKFSKAQFSQEGGVSGAPLSELSKLRLEQAVRFLGERKADRLLVSVGGVMTPEDVSERLKLGADLVQVYSTLIFKGPQFFGHAAKYFDKNSSGH